MGSASPTPRPSNSHDSLRSSCTLPRNRPSRRAPRQAREEEEGRTSLPPRRPRRQLLLGPHRCWASLPPPSRDGGEGPERGAPLRRWRVAITGRRLNRRGARRAPLLLLLFVSAQLGAGMSSQDRWLPLAAPKCHFGASRYRKNVEHRAAFSHPPGHGQRACVCVCSRACCVCVFLCACVCAFPRMDACLHACPSKAWLTIDSWVCCARERHSRGHGFRCDGGALRGG